jgi:UDP-N-acetylmuramoylalanine-D-glutamate ligase
MLEREKPDLVVAFPGGRGTADMVAKARAAGVEVLECA